MSNNPQADENITQRHVRSFIQYGGPGPANAVYYGGADHNAVAISGLTIPDQGAIAPIWEQHPSRPGKYRLVGRTIAPPDLATATIQLREKHGAIPKQLLKQNCVLNLYNNVGKCANLSDFLSGWDDYVMVYSQALVTSKDGGPRSSFAEDANLLDTLNVTLADVYPVGALAFEEEASAQIALEVLDIVYGSDERCGDCGPADDGTQRLYAIAKSTGSTPGTAPKLFYSTDGGVSWTEAAITGIGDIEDPAGLDIVGKYLVVYTRTAGGATTSGYYYAEIDSDTGVPGAWTKVTTGFVAAAQVYDMYVANSREFYFCADGGYIYRGTNVTEGVTAISPGTVTNTALRRIHGDRAETIVAVGGSGVTIVSTNRGGSFATATTYPVVATLQALSVKNRREWWVGSAGGKLYYTLNGGETWTEKTFAGSGAGQVRDVVWATPEVGFFAHDTATPAGRLFATWNGGRDWTNGSPRILNMPTCDRINRVAVPQVDDGGVSSNNVALACLAGDASDGLILVGVASKI